MRWFNVKTPFKVITSAVCHLTFPRGKSAWMNGARVHEWILAMRFCFLFFFRFLFYFQLFSLKSFRFLWYDGVVVCVCVCMYTTVCACMLMVCAIISICICVCVCHALIRTLQIMMMHATPVPPTVSGVYAVEEQVFELSKLQVHRGGCKLMQTTGADKPVWWWAYILQNKMHETFILVLQLFAKDLNTRRRFIHRVLFWKQRGPIYLFKRSHVYFQLFLYF